MTNIQKECAEKKAPVMGAFPEPVSVRLLGHASRFNWSGSHVDG